MVRVFNDRGEMIIPARVTGRIMPGVVDIIPQVPGMTRMRMVSTGDGVLIS